MRDAVLESFPLAHDCCYDPAMLSITIRNASRPLANMEIAGVEGVNLSIADLASYEGKPRKLVVANILAVVLDAYAEAVITYVERPASDFVRNLDRAVRGILSRYTALGCREIGRKTIKEWTSGCFKLVTRTVKSKSPHLFAQGRGDFFERVWED